MDQQAVVDDVRDIFFARDAQGPGGLARPRGPDEGDDFDLFEIVFVLLPLAELAHGHLLADGSFDGVDQPPERIEHEIRGAGRQLAVDFFRRLTPARSSPRGYAEKSREPIAFFAIYASSCGGRLDVVVVLKRGDQLFGSSVCSASEPRRRTSRRDRAHVGEFIALFRQVSRTLW